MFCIDMKAYSTVTPRSLPITYMACFTRFHRSFWDLDIADERRNRAAKRDLVTICQH